MQHNRRPHQQEPQSLAAPAGDGGGALHPSSPGAGAGPAQNRLSGGGAAKVHHAAAAADEANDAMEMSVEHDGQRGTHGKRDRHAYVSRQHNVGGSRT